jgi:rare lipoprotein A
MRQLLFISALAFVVSSSCGPDGSRDVDASTLEGPLSVGQVLRGEASWYGVEFHGKKTANGEVYDMHEVSAAHRTLPFGTVLEVRNLDNGRTARVRINDRGPYVDDRVLDLSKGAARRLGMVGTGVAEVEMEILSLPGQPVFRLQFGAFRQEDNAHGLIERLADLVPGARIYHEAPLFRVQLRDLVDSREARKLAKKIRQRGFDVVVLDAVR